MKTNIKLNIVALLLLSAFIACKKYGYDIPDGYPDDSQNVAGGTIDNNLAEIDKSAYAKARVFPGLVDIAEPRVTDAKFTLDLNFKAQNNNNLRITSIPRNQFSTGFYAAPGELVKIVVPNGIEGLNIQIGGHTDNLSAITTLLRDPVMYMRQRLYAGVNYVRNLYGGTIYINADNAYTSPIEFTISNVCVSPDFILGQTNDATWVNQVKTSLVPWLELRSKSLVLLVPRDKVVQSLTSAQPLDNPTALMTRWNDIMSEDYNGWMGLSDNAASETDQIPSAPWRAVLDIQLSTSNYGHYGAPVACINNSAFFNAYTSVNALTTSAGQWDLYSLFGQNCQQNNLWSWSTLNQTTNNLFSFKIANRLNLPMASLNSKLPAAFLSAIAYANTTGAKNFDSDATINDNLMRLTPFVQICERYNYGAITFLYAQARRNPRLNTSNITMHNFVYEKLSEYTATDLAKFFDAWGIEVSTNSKAKISALYPQLTNDIWNYNPITKIGGNNSI